jgi:hypothetical protein
MTGGAGFQTVFPRQTPRINHLCRGFASTVKRPHRAHLAEFYTFHVLEEDLVQLNKDLRGWEWVYNNIRPQYLFQKSVI